MGIELTDMPAIFYNTSIIYQRVNIHLMERKALVMVVQPTIKNMVQEEVSQMGFKNPCFRLGNDDMSTDALARILLGRISKLGREILKLTNFEIF